MCARAVAVSAELATTRASQSPAVARTTRAQSGGRASAVTVATSVAAAAASAAAAVAAAVTAFCVGARAGIMFGKSKVVSVALGEEHRRRRQVWRCGTARMLAVG